MRPDPSDELLRRGSADNLGDSRERQIFPRDARPGDATNTSYASCDAGLEADRCSARVSVSALGTDDPVGIACLADKDDFSPQGVKPGPDNIRRLECDGTFQITPALPLQTVTSGRAVQVNAPTPGTVTIAPASGSARAVTAKRSAPFRTARKTTATAGAVRFNLKLTRQAKRTLRKRRKLSVRSRITFAPAAGGSKLVSTKRLTLRPSTKRPPRRI